MLQRLVKNYQFSEYWGPDFQPGEVVKGIRHEDLQKLSFESNSLDYIISSDVLEHMPDPYLAHSEIHRVLKPGGLHIFTVPFDCANPRDDVRAKIENGELKHLKPPAYHGDPVRPDEGILVWTIFGLEMLVKMSEIGLVTDVYNVSEPQLGILGKNNVVFVAKKQPV